MQLSKLGAYCCLFVTLVLSLLASDVSSDEQASLIISQDAAWHPFAFLDEEGRPQGLLIDLWRTFGEVNQVPVEFKLVDWQQGLDLVKDGEADLHGGLFHSKERDTYLDFTDDLFPLSTRLFLSSKLKIDGFNDLGDIPVGVTNGGFEEGFVRQNYPWLRLREYPNNSAMVEAASKGELMAFIADYPVGMYYLNKFHIPDQFRVSSTLYTKYLRAAVGEGNADLLAFVQQGLSRISESERERIQQKWILSLDKEVIPAWLLPLVLVASVIALLSALGIYAGLLKRQVRIRTAELQEAITKLELVAQTDKLTGLYNRLKLDEFLAQELRRAARYEHDLSIVIFDIDHFKQINDDYGHQVGDSVLVEIADLLRANARESDVIGRWGGEEFLLIAPGLGLVSALKMAEKFRALLEQKAFSRVGKVTASFGVAAYVPGDTEYSILQRADAGLYEAKEQGRNIILASE